jgi:hypothetical protein
MTTKETTESGGDSNAPVAPPPSEATFVKAPPEAVGEVPPPAVPPINTADHKLHVDPEHDAPTPQGTGQPASGSDVPTQLSNIVVGEIYDGRVVEFIYGSSAEYIVYESDGRLLYAVGQTSFKAIASDRADELMALSELELKGAYSVTIKRLMGMALVRAFDADSAEEAKSAFQAVASFIEANKPVREVFARTRDYIVYLDSRGELVAEFDNIEERFVPIVSEFERLKQSASNNLPVSTASAAKTMLGYELASALRASTSLPPADVFSASHAFIAERVGADISNKYVLTTLIAAVLLGLALLTGIVFPARWLAADARMLSLGALAGMVGACISVLQRSNSVASTQFPSAAQINVQAVVRMTLGVVFGLLVVIAARGNVAFGTFKEPRALFIIAVAAGFSERLIPDLLTKLGRTTNDTASGGGTTPANGSAPKT